MVNVNLFLKGGLLRGNLASPSQVSCLFRWHLEKHDKSQRQSVRREHEAVVGIKVQHSKGDEYDLIAERTRERLEKPKKDRPPFLKNLFIKKIDATILEYPELWTEDLEEVNRQMEPVLKRIKSVDTVQIDSHGTIPNDVYADLANAGAFVAQISREYNGNDLKNVGYARLIESLSENGNVSLGALAYMQGSWISRLIIKYGSEEQKNYFLPQMADGSKQFAYAASEEESGTHLSNMKCSVRLGSDNRGYILDGTKSWVINAPKADYILVIAKHEGVGTASHDPVDDVRDVKLENERAGSMSAFIVPKKAPGVTVGELVPFVGLKGLQVSEMSFKHVALPLDALLGSTGSGFKIAMDAATGERHLIGCIVLPLLRRVLADATLYSMRRRIFNKSLSELHLIRNKLVETAYLTYALESMTYMTAMLMDQTVAPDFDIEAATVRVFAGDMVPRCITNIMQIYGAAGIRMDSEIEQNLRDVLTLFQMDGGTDVARLYITLSCLKYAGVTMAKDIQMNVNPLNHPEIMRKRLRAYFNMNPKRLAYFEDFLHPTLNIAALALEECCRQLFDIVDQLLFTHHKKVIDRQMDLHRLSELMTLIYGAFASLGRCSRAYCLGVKNNQHDMDLALMFMQYASKRTREICRDIEEEGSERDYLVHSAMEVMTKHKGYGCEHALARNY